MSRLHWFVVQAYIAERLSALSLMAIVCNGRQVHMYMMRHKIIIQPTEMKKIKESGYRTVVIATE